MPGELVVVSGAVELAREPARRRPSEPCMQPSCPCAISAGAGKLGGGLLDPAMEGPWAARIPFHTLIWGGVGVTMACWLILRSSHGEDSQAKGPGRKGECQ